MAKPLKRHIGLHHVVFFRACMEDPDELRTADLANRYLETGTNLHEANRVLRLVQESLTQVARRQGRHGAARLLNLPRGRFKVPVLPVQAPATAAITFEDFQAKYDPDGMFGFDELLEIYEAEHGTRQAEAIQHAPERRRTEREVERASRLLQKRIQLINDLSKEIIRDPQPEDWVSGWFADRIANRLEAVEIRTLQDIIDYANFHGNRWWSAIPGVGKLTGDRIIQWLAEQKSFSRPPSEYALTPRRKLGRDAVLKAREAIKQAAAEAKNRSAIGQEAIENGSFSPSHARRSTSPQLAVIAESLSEIDRDTARVAFNGQLGRNRAPVDRCRLDGVVNDMQALQAWLSLHTGTTLLSYRKEVERFALWAVYERSKSVSDLDTADVAAYAEFLTDPYPVEKWVADKRYERGHPGWRPFTKNSKTGTAGLSKRSVAYAIGVLSQACKWLVGQRYLDSNPFDGLPRMTTTVQKAELGMGKSLSTKAWQMLRDATEALALENPGEASFQRGWLALMLGFGTGMRISEIAAAKVGDLHEIDADTGKPAWGLNVIGKGKRQRMIPIPSRVFSLLEADLRARGYDFKTILDVDAEAPLLARLEAYGNIDDQSILEPLTVDAASDVYLQVFERAADRIESDEPHIASRLRRTSPHHLRHTYASMGVKKMQLKHVQDNLGHASIATTSIYLHADKSERFEDTDQFFDKIDAQIQ